MAEKKKISPQEWKRQRGVMARAFYKELKDNGLTSQQVIELSTQILQLVGTYQEGVLEQPKNPT